MAKSETQITDYFASLPLLGFDKKMAIEFAKLAVATAQRRFRLKCWKDLVGHVNQWNAKSGNFLTTDEINNEVFGGE